MTCRFCGGEADPKAVAQKHGRTCRPCLRERVYRRQNTSAAGVARKRRQNHRLVQRRIYIGARCVGLAATADDAARIRAHVQHRLRAFLTQQTEDRRAAFT